MKDPSKLFKKIVIPAAALMLVATFGSSSGFLLSGTAAAAQKQAVVQSSDFAKFAPVWSKAADYMQPVINGNTVYYRSDSKWIAADAATGKTKWSYAAKSFAPVVTVNNSVYLITTTGRIIKLNGENGKVLWSKNVSEKSSKTSDGYNVSDFRAHGAVLYLTDDSGLHRINAMNGKTLRSFSNIEGTPIGVRGNKIFVVSVVSGAYMSQKLNAYDVNTGKKLWEAEQDHGNILGFSEGYVYSRYIPMSLDQGHAASIDKIDLQTGKIVQRYEYIPVDFMGGMSALSIVMLGKHFYIVQEGQFGKKIQEVPVDAPSGTEPRVVVETDSPIVAFDAVGNQAAAVLADGTSLVFERFTWNVLTAAKAKPTLYPLLTLKDEKVFAQTNKELSAVKVLNGDHYW